MKETFGGNYSSKSWCTREPAPIICGEVVAYGLAGGIRAYPRVKPPFPAQIGLYGVPTTQQCRDAGKRAGDPSDRCRGIFQDRCGEASRHAAARHLRPMSSSRASMKSPRGFRCSISSTIWYWRRSRRKEDQGGDPRQRLHADPSRRPARRGEDMDAESLKGCRSSAWHRHRRHHRDG